MLAIGLVAGCNDALFDLEPPPGSIHPDLVLRITRDNLGETMSASGLAQDTVRAILPAGADSPLVSFITTGGKFEPYRDAATKVTVRADSRRGSGCLTAPTDVNATCLVARVVLVTPDSGTGYVWVSASSGDRVRYLKVPFSN